MKKLFTILACVYILSGCKVADFTIVSTKNVDLTQQHTLKKSGAIGKASDLETAIDRAIESGGGTYIMNVKIYEGLFQWKVVGDVY